MAATDKTDFNNPCTQLVHSKVTAIPSVLGRIVFGASCLRPDTSRYHDSALEAQAIGSPCGKPELDEALRHEHLVVFEDWLCLNMRQKLADLECYASHQDLPAALLFRKWTDEKRYTEFIPNGAMPVQRKLFVADMEAVLAIVSIRAMDVGPEPDPS